MGLEVSATPLLATVAGVELGSVGYWNISNQKDWHPTSEEMASCVAALDCPAVRRPALKLGHTGEPGEGDPSIGIVDNLRLTEDGQTLVGDFVGVPAWLAAADNEGRSVLSSAYPDRSGEWIRDYTCQLGHTHPMVLSAMALLGVVRPGIGTLESLYDLYTKAPAKEVAVANAAVALAGTTADEVRKAYYDATPDWSLWIREMYVDPPELIVQNDNDDSLIRVPYVISKKGVVTFGTGQMVKVEYVAARAASEKPAVAFASAAASRSEADASTATPETPLPVEAEGTQEKESTVPFTEAALLKLGLDANADADAINAAIEALPDAATEAGGTTPPAEQAPATLDTPALVAAAAKKLGLTVLDEQTAQKLTVDAAAGREALSRIDREADAKVVKSAIADGKIPPAREAHYLTLMSKDREGTTSWLASVPKEAAVALSEMGHSTEPVVDVAADPTYQNWRF